MAMFPGMGDLAKIGEQVGEFISFGRAALESLGGNQKVIYAEIRTLRAELAAMRGEETTPTEQAEADHGGEIPDSRG